MKCIVVGGGFAGLAAATRLAEGGGDVTLIEKLPRLGGRARSIVDESTGDIIDNGPRLVFGGCPSTRAFQARIGARETLDFSADVRLAWCNRGRLVRFDRSSLDRLSTTFGVLAGLTRFQGFTLTERALALRVPAALKLGDRLAAPAGDRETVDEWLARLSQSAGARRAFWHPIAVAALNDDPRTASAKLFESALRESIFGDRKEVQPGVAKAGLSDLDCASAERFLVERGAKVRLSTAVIELILAGPDGERHIGGVRLEGGERIDADTVIAALPPRPLLDLLPASLHGERGFAGIKRLGRSPIVSIHFWFDRLVTEEPLFGLLDSPIHWVFNRNRLGAVRDASRSALSLVIPAARALVGRASEDLIALGLAELTRALPAVGKAKLVHARVLADPDATIAHPAGDELDRPRCRTAVGGLFLAGDYVRTGLPATVESAVRSGDDAALLALIYEPPAPPPAPPGFVPIARLTRRAAT